MNPKHIRNFSIIAHIDHGKSTLADRMLERTGTIEARKMRDQVLDNMELERERGITIKMQPVRMMHTENGQSYQLNLIDTPGHIDFSYEVSRALKAVEGSILLVDATQGVQAQTLTTLEAARKEGLVIVPAVSKIDSPLARPTEVKLEIAELLDIDPDTVLEVSGRTGEGVLELLSAVIERIPPPQVEAEKNEGLQALVFDFKYDDHRGVIVYVRIFSGSVKRHDRLMFSIAGAKCIALEVGVFTPSETPADTLSAGSIGYIVTGIKQPGIASVGDTITSEKNPMPALAGYENPRPVVWASIYPESQDDFPTLKLALGRLKLSDSAFTFEEESSGALGRGFRAGFLGMLHLEIITERLRREFSLELIVTTPSITYVVTKRGGQKETIYSPHLFPNDGEIVAVEEPWAHVRIIAPAHYISIMMPMLYDHEAEVGETESFGEGRSAVSITMPLREMMRGFFDELKSLTSGYASITYGLEGLRPAQVTRLDIILANEVVPAFTRVVSRRRALEEAEEAVEKLQNILPRQQFEMKVQGFALGRILASRTIKAFRKDVLMHGSKVVGGGDVSRKKKLLEKQKKGKARMKSSGKVNIPHDVFLKMMQRGNDN
jgi:GTP-binding protein LepA